MAVSTETLNPEIQDLYAGKVISVPQVAEESLTLDGFVPFPGNIVIEPIPPDAATKGGIHIPEGARSDKSVGWVVAVNPADERDSDGHGFGFKKGDLVYYRFGAGQEIRIEGRRVVVVQYTDRISDILGHWPAESLQIAPHDPTDPSVGVTPETSPE